MKKLSPFLLVLAACSVELAPVAPERFACIEEAPASDGALPCPASHWCVEGACTPRLFCDVQDSGRRGCADEATRCEPVYTPFSSAVRCERGVHTSTSALAVGTSCGCADGLHCVAFAEGRASTAYPLYVLPEGGALPTGTLGITGEVDEWRMCARACSSEANCPAAHTCRLAAVLDDPLLGDPTSARFTVGVCFPEQVVTSTMAIESQPNPEACQAKSECTARDPRSGCVYRVEDVADHPDAPMGASWANRAIVGRCRTVSTGLAEPGIGCIAGQDCKSGLCVGGSCAQPCNPFGSSACATARCNPRPVERTRSDGEEVVDTVFLCD